MRTLWLLLIGVVVLGTGCLVYWLTGDPEVTPIVIAPDERTPNLGEPFVHANEGEDAAADRCFVGGAHQQPHPVLDDDVGLRDGAAQHALFALAGTEAQDGDDGGGVKNLGDSVEVGGPFTGPQLDADNVAVAVDDDAVEVVTGAVDEAAHRRGRRDREERAPGDGRPDEVEVDVHGSGGEAAVVVHALQQLFEDLDRIVAVL